MKKYSMVVFCLLLLFGCSVKQSDVQKDEKPVIKEDVNVQNGLMQLDMKSLKEKIDSKETFIVMVTQSTCIYCNNMKRGVIPYIREHPDIPFYELEVDMLGTKKADVDENFSELSNMFKEFDGSTPSLFYMKDGNVTLHESGDMDEINFHNFMVDCGMVNEEKKEVEEVNNELKESSYLKKIDMKECAGKIDKKDSFILYIAENDRYNALFSETLAEYAERHKVDVYVLNLTEMEEPETEEEAEKLNAVALKVDTAINSFQYSPSVFHITDGKATDVLVDNVTEAELIAWFEKQQVVDK